MRFPGIGTIVKHVADGFGQNAGSSVLANFAGHPVTDFASYAARNLAGKALLAGQRSLHGFLGRSKIESISPTQASERFRTLPLGRDQTLIDIGSGDGTTFLNTARRYPEARFIGVDYDSSTAIYDGMSAGTFKTMPPNATYYCVGTDTWPEDSGLTHISTLKRPHGPNEEKYGGALGFLMGEMGEQSADAITWFYPQMGRHTSMEFWELLATPISIFAAKPDPFQGPGDRILQVGISLLKPGGTGIIVIEKSDLPVALEVLRRSPEITSAQVSSEALSKTALESLGIKPYSGKDRDRGSSEFDTSYMIFFKRV